MLTHLTHLTHLTTPEKQVFFGNVLFVCCCAFCLAWWLVAFKPTGAVTGPKSCQRRSNCASLLTVELCVTGG